MCSTFLLCLQHGPYTVITSEVLYITGKERTVGLDGSTFHQLSCFCSFVVCCLCCGLLYYFVIVIAAFVSIWIFSVLCKYLHLTCANSLLLL